VLFHCTEIGCRNDSSPIFGRKIRREIYGKRNFTNTCPVLSGFVRLDDTDIVGWNPPLLTKQKNIDAGTSAYGCKKERERLRSRLLSTAIN